LKADLRRASCLLHITEHGRDPIVIDLDQERLTRAPAGPRCFPILAIAASHFIKEAIAEYVFERERRPDAVKNRKWIYRSSY
jgi:hypothetical protein